MGDFLLGLGGVPAAVLGPLLGGLMGWLAANHTARANKQIADRKHVIDEKIRINADRIAHNEDLTERFKILMDSYEARIKGLSGEITELTDQLSEVRHRVAACEARWAAYARSQEGSHGTSSGTP